MSDANSSNTTNSNTYFQRRIGKESKYSMYECVFSKYKIQSYQIKLSLHIIEFIIVKYVQLFLLWYHIIEKTSFICFPNQRKLLDGHLLIFNRISNHILAKLYIKVQFQFLCRNPFVNPFWLITFWWNLISLGLLFLKLLISYCPSIFSTVLISYLKIV